MKYAFVVNKKKKNPRSKVDNRVRLLKYKKIFAK